jgi:hypothetical protein
VTDALLNGKATFEMTTEKPMAIEVVPSGIPEELRSHCQWVCWKYELRKNKDETAKWTKVPVNSITGNKAKSNSPDTWSSFDEAITYHQKGNTAGIGFVFSVDDEFCGVDLDDALDRPTGQIRAWAAPIIANLSSYGEISPSQTGIKLFVKAKLPPLSKHRKSWGEGEVELYDEGRFFAVTGQRFASLPAFVEERQKAIDMLYKLVFAGPPPPPPRFNIPHPPMANGISVGGKTFVIGGGSLTDDEIISKAMNAVNGANFRKLWNGDTSGHNNDDSRADSGLCCHLAFYSNDAATIDRLFRQSKLFRPKWDELHGAMTYGQLTIAYAMTVTTKHYGDSSLDQATLPPPSTSSNIEMASLNNEILYEEKESILWEFDALQLARRGSTSHVVMYTMDHLMGLELPEPEWIVKGILSEGLNILAGKPKQGKSMMALNLALTIAAGGKALGDVQTIPGDVLYLSLEDKFRRVQSRARRMLAGMSLDVNRRLTVATACPKLGRGGLRVVDSWIKRVEHPSLVIVDVWGRFKPPHNAKGNAYEQDYDQLVALKTFVEERSCNALVLLHCRKAKADDVLEEVSGTMGLSGAADGIIVLSRARNSNEAEIFITGRDWEETKLALEFDPVTFCWKSLGPADRVVTGKVQVSILDFMKRQRGTPLFVKTIADGIGSQTETVRTVLRRMAEKNIIRQSGSAWIYPGADETGGTQEEVFTPFN